MCENDVKLKSALEEEHYFVICRYNVRLSRQSQKLNLKVSVPHGDMDAL